ncbi:MAG: serpin family protein, partial [Lachnospiraceae bacterium]|nr:serpin family protein [Lachnospiraceae bacterium]
GEFSILGLDVESLLKSRSNDYLVSASMPKLNFSTTASKVEDILKSQGIQKPFDITAEFDKIIEEEQLFIDQIIQKCKIELDENGTKAAAVTAITLRANGLFVVDQETKEVILDRPFAFMIYDSVNDEIVFIGKVTDVE